MQELYKKILENIGEDITREGLCDTPKRASEAMNYLTRGYHLSLDNIIKGSLFNSDLNEMVIMKDLELYSMCEHHLLPFFGKCHIGYMPNGKVIGLSRMAHIVDYFAKRLQIQERLTSEIANCIADITGAYGVGVIIEAKHLCMMMRDVEKQNAIITTSVMLGNMKSNQSSRMEFLNLIR